MELGDLAQVIALDQRSFTLPWPASAFLYEMGQNQAARCWVVETSGASPQFLGMMVAWLILDEIHIATLAVDPAQRHLHVGQRLLAYTLMDGAANGAGKALLEVRRGNLAARAMYQKFGFTEVGVRKRYYSDNGEDAILMSLDPIDPDVLELLL